MAHRRLTADDVRDRLRIAISAYGDQTQLSWARAHGISPTYLSEVLKGSRAPGRRVLEPLGLRESAPTYEDIDRSVDENR